MKPFTPSCIQTGVLLVALLLFANLLPGQNVGIGTATPASKLDVNGNLTVGTGYTGTAAPNDGAIIEGNVGIGTTAPSARLHIANGGVNIEDSGHPGFPTGFRFVSIGDDAYITDLDVANFMGVMGGQNPDRGGIFLGGDAGYIFGDNGFVGIGTTSPSTALQVNGAIRIGNTAQTAAGAGAGSLRWNGTAVQYSDGTSWANVGNTTGWGLTGNAGTAAGTNFIGTTDNVRFDIRTNNAIRATFDVNGNMGIGTTTPGNRLEVFGGIGNVRLGPSTTWDGVAQPTVGGSLPDQFVMLHLPHIPYLQNGAHGHTGSTTGSAIYMASDPDVAAVWQMGILGGLGGDKFGLQRGGSTLLAVDNAGNVGIGTATPNAALQIENGGINIVDNGYGGFPTGFRYVSVGDDAYITDLDVANFLGVMGGQNPDRGGIFLGGDAGYIFGDNGFVGIGTTSPSTAFQVNGAVRIGNTAQTAAVAGAGSLRWNGTAVQYSDGTNWASIGGSGWGLTGNAGTTYGTHFIGTTDNVGLQFRVNNVASGYVQVSGAVALGYQAGLVNSNAEAVAIGTRAMASNTSGVNNTATGYRAMEQNTTGQQNAAFGHQALRDNLTGQRNTALGFAAMYTATGSRNTVVGALAGDNLSTGSSNTLIGYEADVAATATNATAVGNLAYASADNALVLGSVTGTNGATATANVGIGLTAPAARLHVSGTFRLEDGTQAAGRVLTSDASGNASWQAASGADNLGNHTATTQIQSTAGTAAAPGYSFAGDLNTGLFAPGADQVAIATGSGERLRILANGNVGIGTTTPGSRLEVLGGGSNVRIGTGLGWGGASSPTISGSAADQFVMITLPHIPYLQNGMHGHTGSSLGAAVYMASDPNVGAYWKMGMLGDITGTDRFAIGRNATSFLTIQNDGNVGIGTNVPNRQLHVSADPAGTWMMQVGRSTTAGEATIGFLGDPALPANLWITGAGAWGNTGDYVIGSTGLAGPTIIIDGTNGRVGMGTNAPDQLLTVNGNASKPGGGAFLAFSDARLKQNVSNFTPGLAELMQLRTVNYEYRPNNELGIRGNGSYTGFIAQEVQRVLPMAVTETESGFLQLNTDPIVWTMLNSIQEQQREIERLRAEVQGFQTAQAQTNETAELRAQLDVMRQQIETLTRTLGQQGAR